MVICKTAPDIAATLLLHQQPKSGIGFVPTMGALHQGHISLIKTAKQQCPVVVSSIFVNPTQFNDLNDFEKYPVTIEKDIDALEAAGCDVLFLPAVKEMYPQGLAATEIYQLGFLETVLEGKYRPGHFQGVCRVVQRLFDIVKPQIAFFGQKDYQQCMVIQKLVELKNMPIELFMCPTQREPNGLAMSSRNMRLTVAERQTAAVIYQTLQRIGAAVTALENDFAGLKMQAAATLTNAGFRPDYVEIADAATLELLKAPAGRKKIVALIAAYLGEVRLIDNLVIDLGKG
jgi:pantoate--beta-alanine ligase